MVIIILLLLALIIVGCYICFSTPNSEKKPVKNQQKYSELFNSNNTNSYPEAREVFQTLNAAGIDSNFLGDE